MLGADQDAEESHESTVVASPRMRTRMLPRGQLDEQMMAWFASEDNVFARCG